MRIAVVTKNKFLYQKIKLALLGRADTAAVSSISDAQGFELCLLDTSAVKDYEPRFAASHLQSNSAPQAPSEAKLQALNIPKHQATDSPEYQTQESSKHHVPSEAELQALNIPEHQVTDSPEYQTQESSKHHVPSEAERQALIISERQSHGIGFANPTGIKIITMGEGGDLPLPFAFTELFSAIEGCGGNAPKLTLGERCAYLRGEKIPLTEVELALLRVLYDAKGEYVSREELLSRVWAEGTDNGVVNVYVYYLRQKLERGEKIINTSRKLGYKIDANYLGGGVENA